MNLIVQIVTDGGARFLHVSISQMQVCMPRGEDPLLIALVIKRASTGMCRVCKMQQASERSVGQVCSRADMQAVYAHSLP